QRLLHSVDDDGLRALIQPRRDVQVIRSVLRVWCAAYDGVRAHDNECQMTLGRIWGLNEPIFAHLYRFGGRPLDNGNARDRRVANWPTGSSAARRGPC